MVHVSSILWTVYQPTNLVSQLMKHKLSYRGTGCFEWLVIINCAGVWCVYHTWLYGHLKTREKHQSAFFYKQLHTSAAGCGLTPHTCTPHSHLTVRRNQYTFSPQSKSRLPPVHFQQRIFQKTQPHRGPIPWGTSARDSDRTPSRAPLSVAEASLVS